MSQPRSLSGNTFENVIDETVHDAHSFRTDSCIGMDLLQNLIDVNGIALIPLRFFLLSLFEILFVPSRLSWLLYSTSLAASSEQQTHNICISQTKPSQTKELTGAESYAKRKSTSSCLLAIPAFERTAGLSNKFLNSNRVIC